MKETSIISKNDKWAYFRLTVIGELLANPPKKGKLKERLKALCECLWVHPISKKEVRFGFSTLESWYYKCAKTKENPISYLKRKARSDSGRFNNFSQKLKDEILSLHENNPTWSHKLHYDNLVALSKEIEDLKIPSYTTILRYRKEHGFFRLKMKPKFNQFFSKKEEIKTYQNKEVRSYTNPCVNGLWHTDFHHCSRTLLRNGKWVKPKLAAVMDDHSRLICHLQWYFDETAENLIHTYMQAFLKCGLPKSLLSDNGGPMTALETKSGLLRLGILHETTLPYSPHQNGKQENFFSLVEGRLMAMLKNVKDLTLDELNRVTHAWLEEEYQVHKNSRSKKTPKEAFVNGKYIGRDSPSIDEMEKLFCIDVRRKLRKSDGTIQLEGVRFEVPNHYRHFTDIYIRYASFKKNKIWLINETTKEIVVRLYPVDYEENSDKRRKTMPKSANLVVINEDPENKKSVLLEQLVKKHEAKNLPVAYIKKED